MNKVLYKSTNFMLERRKRKYRKQFYYRITWHAWSTLTGDNLTNIKKDLVKLQEYPKGRGWYRDYLSKDTASQRYTMLLLKYN